MKKAGSNGKLRHAGGAPAPGVPPRNGTREQQPSRYFVPALEKGLDVLEVLANDSVPQGLSELSRTLNRTSSELFRIVDCLERRGYLSRDELSGNYSLSLKLYQLAHMHSPVEQLLKAAAGPMRILAQSVRESCHISVLADDKLVVVAQAESPEPIRLSVEVGGRFSPVATTSGRVLLAHLPKEERESLLTGDPGWLSTDDSEQEETRSLFHKIARQGYHIARSETRAGMKDVAVIVGNPRIRVAAALCVPCLMAGREESSIRDILSALQDCARAIESQVGLAV